MTLTGMEVPSRIRIGIKQGLVVHRLIGGDKIIQSLGSDPDSLQWGALFTGPSALARAQQLQSIARAGLQIQCSVAGIQLRAKITDYSFDLQDKLAVLPYSVEIEVQPTPATTGTPTASELSNLVGPTIGNAITGLSSMASNVATYASGLIGQAQTIAGQAFPIANMLGAGGLVAGITDKLTAAQGLASAGINLSQAPAAATGIITTLQSAGSGLSTLLSQAGTNLDSTAFSFSNLPFLRANGDIQTAAVDAGAQVNLAIVQAQSAAGMTVTPAVVHA